jgi:hypothetical protein
MLIMLNGGISAGAKHCAAKTPKTSPHQAAIGGVSDITNHPFIAISAGTGTFPAIAGNEPSEIDD